MLASFELKIPPVVVFTIALMLTSGAAWLDILPLPHPLRPLGFVLFIAGGAIGITGVVAFRQHHTTVNPYSPHKASRLVDSGIFAYSRNPMYLGLVVAIVGFAFILREACGFLFALLTFIYLQRFQIIPEERTMRELFGEEFDDYCQRTKRWYGRND
ncbi:methyltransferase family protein [Alteromonas gilva]|uniref:Isoprenylcysteine carboxylmethyltransferase family protein n=1 Tax=Alteromonas gilva TaxID=2987522 RepID=A0ABT5L0U2_9ALTE|nr:isoprenylcysteine carboxylmethyltransferase family protein [Alteromonas gilva]MDC8830654.1 isoprenylcysteine carboxylmethyltransferase family protein [Alteromonas gilva]